MEELHIAPKVSIGMPVFNGEKYLKEAIDSILSQSFTDFELIISDNASTDITQSICEEYALRDARIRYVRQPVNQGALANFQFVLDQAKGEYFIWFAHDDRWDPTFFSRAIEILESDGDCGLVFSSIVVRNLDTHMEERIHARSVVSNSRAVRYLQAILNMRSSMLYGMYRVDLLRRNQLELFDFADINLILNTALESNIRVLDDFLYIAGIKGVRVPYSLTNRKIRRMPFLKTQYQSLGKYFGFPLHQILFSVICMYMLYNKIRLWRY